MNCAVESEWLHHRGAQLVNLLDILSGGRRLAFDRSNSGGAIRIAVYSGPKPVSDPRDWRFSTGSKGIQAAFFEIWKPLDETRRRYYLFRSYLHLYRYTAGEFSERELLALHCDPNEEEDVGILKHALYKRGPHIHIEASEYPLPRAHIPLNMSDLDTVLSSAELMTEAMAVGLKLVRDQVLDVYDHWLDEIS